MQTVVFSSTAFGYKCIEEGLIPTNDVSLVGIVTTEPVIDLGNGKSMTLSTHADFEQLAKASDCELIKIESRPTVADYQEIIDRTGAEIVLVLGWYFMIPPEVLTLPTFGMLGIHASLLPKYRGMAPVNWALINGETETGVTLFYLAHGVDEGDIVAQTKIPIMPGDDCRTLYEKVSAESIIMLGKNLPMIASAVSPRLAQDHEAATVYPLRTPADGLIDFSLTAQEVHNFVRAQTRPYPGAFIIQDNRKVNIWKSSLTDQRIPDDKSCGEFFSDTERLFVRCSDASLELTDIEIEGMSEDNNKHEQLVFLCCKRHNKCR